MFCLPTIASYANQLLHGSFGNEFFIKFVTQDTETGKEIFDILVYREGQEPYLFSVKSGGEKVWIHKSIEFALAKIAREKSGRQFLTTLSDEGEAALDKGRAEGYINLCREFMAQSGFETCFLISHNQDIIRQADQILQFKKGEVITNV